MLLKQGMILSPQSPWCALWWPQDSWQVKSTLLMTANGTVVGWSELPYGFHLVGKCSTSKMPIIDWISFWVDKISLSDQMKEEIMTPFMNSLPAKLRKWWEDEVRHLESQAVCVDCFCLSSYGLNMMSCWPKRMLLGWRPDHGLWRN